MENEVNKYLYDILEACKSIEEFAKDKTLDQYRSDPLLRSAVERQFQIAGEALQQLLKRYPDIARKISGYRNIINFRNILVHGYNHVDDDVVWGLIQSHLNILHKEIELLISGE
jgi:uncharacterized protein with HEPN domain